VSPAKRSVNEVYLGGISINQSRSKHRLPLQFGKWLEMIGHNEHPVVDRGAANLHAASPEDILLLIAGEMIAELMEARYFLGKSSGNRSPTVLLITTSSSKKLDCHSNVNVGLIVYLLAMD
jgi:hypothetical protein